MSKEIQYCESEVCECGATYGEHISEVRTDGSGEDDLCPEEETQTFSPFRLLWPENYFVN